MATGRPLRREKWRATGLLVGVLGLCACLGCAPDVPAWPIPAGLGGAFGDLMPRIIGIVRGGGATLLDTILVGGLGSVLALGGFYVALSHPNAGAEPEEAPTGIYPYSEGRAEDEEEDDPSDRRLISLGAFTHTLLSLKARLLPRRRAAPKAALARGAEPHLDARTRVEPGFAPAARRAAVQEDDPEEAEMYEDGAVARREPAPARKAPARGRAAEPAPPPPLRCAYHFPN